MSIETDADGRLYLSAELREKYGERFHVVEYADRIELIPIDEDPLQAARDAVGDAFEGTSVAQLRADALSEARADAKAGLKRGVQTAESERESADGDRDE